MAQLSQEIELSTQKRAKRAGIFKSSQKKMAALFALSALFLKFLNELTVLGEQNGEQKGEQNAYCFLGVPLNQQVIHRKLLFTTHEFVSPPPWRVACYN